MIHPAERMERKKIKTEVSAKGGYGWGRQILESGNKEESLKIKLEQGSGHDRHFAARALEFPPL